MSFCRRIWIFRGSETSECRKRKRGANMEENMEEKGFGRAVWFGENRPKQGFSDGSAGKKSARNAGDMSLIPGSGRSPGEGKDNSLQCSSLNNWMDTGAWQATVQWIAKSWTQLSDQTQRTQHRPQRRQSTVQRWSLQSLLGHNKQRDIENMYTKHCNSGCLTGFLFLLIFIYSQSDHKLWTHTWRSHSTHNLNIH